MTLVLRLIMNGGFSFDSANRVFRVFRVSWVNRRWSPSEVQHNVTTKLAHVHEQSEFTYGGYLVAAEHLYLWVEWGWYGALSLNHAYEYCLCVSCVGPLCGPPLRWWVLCGALPSVWVPCVGPLSLCGSPVWVPCVGPLCVGPLWGSPVWVPRRAAFHVASTRVMSPARSHAPALNSLSLAEYHRFGTTQIVSSYSGTLLKNWHPDYQN